MKVDTLKDLFQNGLYFIHDAEKQLTKALPKMAQAASTPELKQAFEQHLQETRNHVTRLEQVFSQCGIKPDKKTNEVLEAMVSVSEKMIDNTSASAVRDAALIVAGNQMEHYEVGSYGSLRTFAHLLGFNEAIPLLDQTLQEEKQADAKLTQVGETKVNRLAAQGAVAHA